MKLNNVRLSKVVAGVTTLVYLGTCGLTVEACVTPMNSSTGNELKAIPRTVYWAGQSSLEGSHLDPNDEMTIIVDTVDGVFTSGAGFFMPSLNEIVVTEGKSLDEISEGDSEKVSLNESVESNLRMNLTEAELTLMYKIVAAEAKGESYEGKIAVAEVIFNRIDSDKFQDNVTDVIYAPKQFQPVRNGHLETAYDNLSASLQEEVRNAVDEALKGSSYAGGALFFKTKNYHEGRTPIKQIGNHYFSK